MSYISFTIILFTSITIAILMHNSDALLVRLLRVHNVKKTYGSGHGSANGASAGALGVFVHGLLNNKHFNVLGGAGYGMGHGGAGIGLDIEGNVGPQEFKLNKHVGNSFGKDKSGGEGRIIDGNAHGYGSGKTKDGDALAAAVVMPNKTKNANKKPVQMVGVVPVQKPNNY